MSEQEWIDKLNLFLVLDDVGLPFHQLDEDEQIEIKSMYSLGLTPDQAHQILDDDSEWEDDDTVIEMGFF